MTSSTQTDIVDAGRLIGWAARPKEHPARHEDYDRLVRRYLDDDVFAETCDAFAAGLGLTLSVDRQVGAIAIAEPDSALRMPMADFSKRVNSVVRRAVNGAVLLAIARMAYPNPAQLDDVARVPRVSVGGVVEYLNRICDQRDAEAGDAEAHDEGLDELWRAWLRLRQSRSESQRSSSAERSGLVKKMCGFLEAEGMLSAVSDDDGGTWRATSRMRIAVRDLVEDSDIYGALLERERAANANTTTEAVP